MPQRKIIVIGASAGGVEALIRLNRDLPADLGAPVVVVVHISRDSPGLLPRILARQGRLPAVEGEDRTVMQNGHIYVAPPDRHILVTEGGLLRTMRGPRENRHRPAIDPLFRSTAVAFGPNAIGIVLTGNLDDGTAGLAAIKRSGGMTAVQDPADALYPSMPLSALTNAHPDAVLPLSGMASWIVEAVAAVPERPRIEDDDLRAEANMSDGEAKNNQIGRPSVFSCPDCEGVLWEIDEEDFVRYRCRVGHAFSPENMLAAQSETLEEALWAAVKTLEENASLAHKLARREQERGHVWTAERFAEREREARERATVIRQVLRDSALFDSVQQAEE